MTVSIAHYYQVIQPINYYFKKQTKKMLGRRSTKLQLAILSRDQQNGLNR